MVAVSLHTLHSTDSFGLVRVILEAEVESLVVGGDFTVADYVRDRRQTSSLLLSEIVRSVDDALVFEAEREVGIDPRPRGAA